MDILAKIELYLAANEANRDYSNDSFAVENDVIVRWEFQNIPQPTQEELDAIF